MNDTKTKRFISYYPDQLKYFERQQNPDGSWNILFKDDHPLRSGLLESAAESPGLTNLSDVNKIGDILNKLSHSH